MNTHALKGLLKAFVIETIIGEWDMVMGKCLVAFGATVCCNLQYMFADPFMAPDILSTDFA